MTNVGKATSSEAKLIPESTGGEPPIAQRQRRTLRPSPTAQAKMERVNVTDKKLTTSVATERFHTSQSQSPPNHSLVIKNKFNATSSFSEGKIGNVRVKTLLREESLKLDNALEKMDLDLGNLSVEKAAFFRNCFREENLKYIFTTKVTKDGGIKFGKSLENETDPEKIEAGLASRELAVYDGERYHLTPDHPAVKDGEFNGPIYFKEGVSYPHDSNKPPQINVLTHEQAAQFLAAGAAHIAYLRSLNQETRRIDQDAVNEAVHKDEIKKNVIKTDDRKKDLEHQAVVRESTVLHPAESLNSRDFYEKLDKKLEKEIKTGRRIFDFEIEKEQVKKRRLDSSS